jgi:hypothetical protein
MYRNTVHSEVRRFDSIQRTSPIFTKINESCLTTLEAQQDKRPFPCRVIVSVLTVQHLCILHLVPRAKIAEGHLAIGRMSILSRLTVDI